MDWNDAAVLARTLMNEHGLGHVPFQGNNARRTAGVTRFRVRIQFGRVIESQVTSIELSRPIVACNDEAVIRDTILHEIAHALCPANEGHGWTWKQKAREVGANPERYCGAETVAPKGAYKAECSCGDPHYRYRRTTRPKICRVTRQRLEFRRVEENL